MLTINHTISTPTRTTESIFSVAGIQQLRIEGQEAGPRFDGDHAGVKLIMPDGSEMFHPARLTGCIGSFERFYVMNEHGKTVATYSL